MASIFKIMIRCPVTTQEFDTGIRTTGREALNNNAYQQGVISCIFCSQFHSLDESAFGRPESESQSSDALWRPNP